jgi:hypothetical protein
VRRAVPAGRGPGRLRLLRRRSAPRPPEGRRRECAACAAGDDGGGQRCRSCWPSCRRCGWTRTSPRRRSTRGWRRALACRPRRGTRWAAPDADGDRAFAHDCGSAVCLHGLARWEPELFKQLAELLRGASAAGARRAALNLLAPARSRGTYHTAPRPGAAPSALHAAMQEGPGVTGGAAHRVC